MLTPAVSVALDEANITAYTNDPIVRIRMVREAKYLMQEQTMLQNRIKSWQLHKAKLIRRFEAQNSHVAQMPLGRDNRYGERIAEKRRRAFYDSLQRKERKMKERLREVARRLSELKEEFRFRYGVELTEEEIFEGKAPRIKEREEKIAMLKEYIRYMRSYDELRRMNEKYDRAEALMRSIAKIDAHEEDFEENLTRRAEENRQKMFAYRMMAQRLSEEFYNRYRMELTDKEVAAQFLENIEKSRH